MVASLLACGIDPNRTILFRQSDVPEHTQLAWLLAALCTTSQLQRMPQFREKSQRFGDCVNNLCANTFGDSFSYRHGNIPVCLLTYPVLQAADILLYRGTHVPVGDDQTTHMQMSADIATHFNNFYQCQYFPIPIQVCIAASS
jgi:tryptophanyl-tRNA synthetase